ncbi:MAG: flagellar hook-basal body complex protein [Hydrogenovibrio sp.]|uniref:flagellar hook protein FlgE n=1 Tax=Hydrogenovibrio sp. TaxID=2065821 RepID=UPI0028701C51|nr:flagellar hook-basal body complex protein [Hydrogenovibrio sp.]MDR9499350.1 flagellar hook-basal body complex protein [Hydrogenovibrio sp.]
MGSAYDLTAVSGINAASKGLGVISNNLANAQTVGFKGSRAEFSDMFYGSQNSPGNGVRVETITQDFSNGTINDTGRDLDMGIDGEGFFVLEDKTGRFNNVYTRNGSFKLDKEGFLTAQDGNKVQGYLLNEGLSTENNPEFFTTLSSIDMDELNKRPRPTDEMNFDINLDGQENANYDPDGNDINKVIDDVRSQVFSDIVAYEVDNNGASQAQGRDIANQVLDQVDLKSIIQGAPDVATAKANLADAAIAGSLQYDYTGLTDPGHGTTNVDLAAVYTSGEDADFAERIVDSGYQSMVTSAQSLSRLTNPEQNGEYGGFPDFTTNKIIYDTLGGEHRLTTNFYKRDVVEEGSASNNLNEKYTSWIVQYSMEDFNKETGEWETSGHVTGTDPKEAGQIYEMRFDVNGDLIDMRQPTSDGETYDAGGIPPELVAPGEALAPYDDTAPTPGWSSVGRSAPIEFVIDNPLTGAQDPLGNENAQREVVLDADYTRMSQFAGDYNLRGVTQNGYNVGDLVGVTTSLDGVIEARYSNGRSVPIAQVALANFNDKNAMEKLGGQTYAETFSSGAVQLGTPQNNGFGTVNAGTLEYSNVDTAGELVNMIQTQRTYQASAQVIQTSQTLTQTILQL